MIDDLGGGFELGRRFLTSWLNGDLSPEMDTILEKEYGIHKNNFVKNFYEKPELELISSLPELISSLREDPVVNKLIRTYFGEFIDKQILPLCSTAKISSFSIVGSIGFFFYRDIQDVAKSMNVSVDQCIQSPIQRLVKYHAYT